MPPFGQPSKRPWNKTFRHNDFRELIHTTVGCVRCHCLVAALAWFEGLLLCDLTYKEREEMEYLPEWWSCGYADHPVGYLGGTEHECPPPEVLEWQKQRRPRR